MDQTHTPTHTQLADFANLIDLAGRRLGSRAIAASDDYFAERDNLLKPDKAVFIPGKFTERGKWMDGWESRHKRTQGHDWCIIALGRSGSISGVNVDTSHFNGNQPEFCSLEGVECENDVTDAELAAASAKLAWKEIIPRTPLKPSSEHLIAAHAHASASRFTHVRLNIFPDGGVARLRVYGHVKPDWAALVASGKPIDLAAAENGALVIAANDMHFGSRHNLILPGRAADMGDGWETRRKRGLTWGAGGVNEFDWCIVRLGHRGTINAVEVDTNHFRGNFPESGRIEVCDAGKHGEAKGDSFNAARAQWTELLPRTKLAADHQHPYEKELNPAAAAPCTHARLSIFPDGGISRLRLWGRPLL